MGAALAAISRELNLRSKQYIAVFDSATRKVNLRHYEMLFVLLIWPASAFGRMKIDGCRGKLQAHNPP